MGFNGSGVFQRAEDWTDDRDAGGDQAKISATKMDIEFDNFKDGLTQCITKNGETTITANLPMAGFRHTGVGNASARTHYPAVGQLQDGSLIKGTVGGTGNAITLTLSPVITAYAAGQLFWFIATAANTTAVTVNVNSVGAKNVRKGTGSTALVANDITVGQVVGLYYDGTQLQIVTPVRGQLESLAATYQPLDATLTAFAGLTIAADQIVVGTGADAFTMSAFGFPVPGGRLTLTSATPILAADATAQATVYYAPLGGRRAIIPVYNGTSLSLYDFLSSATDNVGLSLNMASNAAWASGSVYDWFYAYVSGVLYFGTGPAWSSTTSRGTGAGTTELQIYKGLWTNKNSMTLRTGTGSTQTVPANQGTYLGSMYCTANGQTGMQFRPSAGAGGSNAIMALYNAYNRQSLTCISRDSTASWTYTTASWRAANNNNNNRVTFLDGLQQSKIAAKYIVAMATSSSAILSFAGVNLNSVSAQPTGAIPIGSTNGAAFPTCGVAEDDFLPVLGLNYVQAMEYSSGATTTYYSAQSVSQAALFCSLEM